MINYNMPCLFSGQTQENGKILWNIAEGKWLNSTFYLSDLMYTDESISYTENGIDYQNLECELQLFNLMIDGNLVEQSPTRVTEFKQWLCIYFGKYLEHALLAMLDK